MAVEIEKKFLLTYLPVNQMTHGVFIRQGYLVREKERVVRVRLCEGKGFLTIKGETRGACRSEFEYPIPEKDAREMLDRLCSGPVIEKTRFQIGYKGFQWVIDQFAGDNQGLVVAEIELEDEDQTFEKPDWIGQEVTRDPRYFNSNLITTPFSAWQTENS